MNRSIRERVTKEANLMINNNYTIREIAKHLRISKSTVHYDLKNRLIKINKELYLRVQSILNKHLEIRHINGGIATKNKYRKEGIK